MSRSSDRSGLMAERGNVHPEFVDAGDQHAQVVADHLAQDFVHLTHVGLAPQTVPELGLDPQDVGVTPVKWRAQVRLMLAPPGAELAPAPAS